MKDEEGLEKLREEVRGVTEDIIHLLGERLSLVGKIYRVKEELGMPVRDHQAEERLAEAVRGACRRYGVDERLGLRVVNLLIQESLKIQEAKAGKPEQPIIYQIFGEAKRLEQRGRRIIHMEVGEPDYGPPERVREALYQALQEGRSRYTRPEGILPLREGIAEDLERRRGVKVDPDQILVTIGGKMAIYLALATLITPGDEVIVLEPGWPVHKLNVARLGGKPVVLGTELEEGWNPNLDRLASMINPATKMIVINNPHNPTGIVYEKETIKGIVDLALDHNLIILSDEVYSELAPRGFESVLNHQCKSVYIQSFSKTYGMTGFRVGYAVSSPEIIKRMASLQSLTVTSVPEFIQYAAIEALQCWEEAEGYRELTRKRIDVACKELDGLPVSYKRPEGAFYVFPRIDREGFDSVSFAWRLLREKGVCVTPGAGFGDYPSHLRVSIPLREELIREGIRKIGEILTR